MKVDFSYQVNGRTYTVSTRTLDTFRLTDSKDKMVLYDPMEPGRAVILDSLPGDIRFDETKGQFLTDLSCLTIPLLAATLVGAEIVAI